MTAPLRKHALLHCIRVWTRGLHHTWEIFYGRYDTPVYCQTCGVAFSTHVYHHGRLRPINAIDAYTLSGYCPDSVAEFVHDS